MRAFVDIAAMQIRADGASFGFALDAASGHAVFDPAGEAVPVRVLRWGEKNALSRFAALGADFFEMQLLATCARPVADPVARAAATALTLWLHGPFEPPLPLDERFLARVTLAVCQVLAARPQDIAERPAPEIEALWRALGQVGPQQFGLAQQRGDVVKQHPAWPDDDVTRIIVLPDPVGADGEVPARPAASSTAGDDRRGPEPSPERGGGPAIATLAAQAGEHPAAAPSDVQPALDRKPREAALENAGSATGDVEIAAPEGPPGMAATASVQPPSPRFRVRSFTPQTSRTELRRAQPATDAGAPMAAPATTGPAGRTAVAKPQPPAIALPTIALPDVTPRSLQTAPPYHPARLAFTPPAQPSEMDPSLARVLAAVTRWPTTQPAPAAAAEPAPAGLLDRFADQLELAAAELGIAMVD